MTDHAVGNSTVAREVGGELFFEQGWQRITNIGRKCLLPQVFQYLWVSLRWVKEGWNKTKSFLDFCFNLFARSHRLCLAYPILSD